MKTQAHPYDKYSCQARKTSANGDHADAGNISSDIDCKPQLWVIQERGSID